MYLDQCEKLFQRKDAIYCQLCTDLLDSKESQPAASETSNSGMKLFHLIQALKGNGWKVKICNRCDFPFFFFFLFFFFFFLNLLIYFFLIFIT